MFPESQWGAPASKRVVDHAAPVPKGGGIYKVGTPYQVGGKWYNPRIQPEYDRVGIASWYGTDFHGRNTANGEVYDMNALTAAHPTLPLPSYAYVTSLTNRRTILVRVNDRGPYVADRVIDLSQASARELALVRGGTGRVRVRYAGPAPLDGNDSRERAFLASRPWRSRLAAGKSAPTSSAARMAAASDAREREIVLGSRRRWPSRVADAAPSSWWSPREAQAAESWSPAAYRAGRATR